MISYSLFLENVYWGPLCVRQLEDKVHYVPSEVMVGKREREITRGQYLTDLVQDPL